MAKGRASAQLCPLGCGMDISGVIEHQCGVGMPTDHLHVFSDEGVCRCGLDLDDAIKLAGEGALAADIPAASTACARCDAPITPDQRRASGLCDECLAESVRNQDRPTLLLNVDALKVCTVEGCGAMFDTLTDLEMHRSESHPPETRTAQLRRRQTAGERAEDTARLRELEGLLEVAHRDILAFTAAAEAELKRRGVAV